MSVADDSGELPVVNAPKTLHRIRWPWLLAGGGVLLAAVVLHFFNPAAVGFYPSCLFHKVTGLHCPGCGGLRATHHLLQGEIGTAFAMNGLLFVLAPMLGWYAVQGLQGKVTGVSRRVGIALLILVLAFWVLRNLPMEPFSRLAPG
ncbi:MAG: hypothetical protein ACI9TH_002966 [Kiritimatiellia bacterium]